MKKLYAILDSVAGDIVALRMYSLMTFRTHEEAARYFADAINDTSSILNKHPQDYVLIHCGNLAEDGKIDALWAPEQIVRGDTVLALQQPALVKEA